MVLSNFPAQVTISGGAALYRRHAYIPTYHGRDTPFTPAVMAVRVAVNWPIIEQ